MKSELITPIQEPKQPEIDWSKRQTLIYKDFKLIVGSNGEHSGKYFSATVLHDSPDGHGILYHSRQWLKEKFTPLTHPIQITFTND